MKTRVIPSNVTPAPRANVGARDVPARSGFASGQRKDVEDRRSSPTRCGPGLAALLLLLFVLSTISYPLSTFGQTTQFTYQGILTVNGTNANGSNDLTFTLYNAASGGATVGVSNVVNDLAITNGLFTVTLDFLAAPFDGSALWLQIAARPGASTGAYTNLSPRQPVTATPYAIRAANFSGAISNVQLAGTYGNAVTLNNAANSFTGNGTGLTNVNAVKLGGLSASNFWRTAGNAGANPTNGAFLGTTDNLPLEIKVNGERALRIEPNPGYGAVNIVGGCLSNFVAPGVVGVTIHGGGATNYGGSQYANSVSSSFTTDYGTIGGGAGNTISFGQFATVGGGWLNTVSGASSTVGGGVGNTASIGEATVAGGAANTASGQWATVSGGDGNTASGVFASVGGGDNNMASGYAATVGGGYYNSASGDYAVIPGGYNNTAGGQRSFAAGRSAQALHDGSFVWADNTAAYFTSTSSNQFLIRAGGGVGIGTTNPLALLNVNGNARVDADNSVGYGEGLSLNFPTDMPVGGYGGIHFHNAARGGNYDGGTIKWSIFYNSTPDPGAYGKGLAFIQNNVNTRLYLGTNGNVGIGTTSPTHQLELSTDSAAKPGGGSWANSSDARLKKNIQPLTGALEKLTQLRGVRFEWVNPEDHANQHGPQGGFIAQEVERTFPHWVTSVVAAEHDRALTDDGKIKSLTLPFEFDALVVEAIKEQQQQIKARDEKIADLEQRVATLEKLLNRFTTAQTGDER